MTYTISQTSARLDGGVYDFAIFDVSMLATARVSVRALTNAAWGTAVVEVKRGLNEGQFEDFASVVSLSADGSQDLDVDSVSRLMVRVKTPDGTNRPRFGVTVGGKGND